MFTPKWKKDALRFAKDARKFIHYKRDLLKPERLAEIESRRADLLAAVKLNDAGKISEASRYLRASFEGALPHERPLGWLEENIEVLFVAVVIALGLRTYYLQPFRIPTGSMQPTLNGITGHRMPSADWPALPQRLFEKAARGRTYVKIVTPSDRKISRVARADGKFDYETRDVRQFFFFSRGEIVCADGGPPIRLPAPVNPCGDAGLGEAFAIAASNNDVLPKGTVICEGYIDTGDLVLVDKVSYHFRKPERGEVFVFDTIGIRGIADRSGDQGGGSHYIKRLCGVPGDTLSISPPHLLVDGKIAREPGIRRVANAEGEYGPAGQEHNNGYILADAREVRMHQKPVSIYLTKPSDTLTLSANPGVPALREYAALGDNTGSSLDSRYWGPLKQYNLVGPALFSLWPVTTGHWGLIR